MLKRRLISLAATAALAVGGAITAAAPASAATGCELNYGSQAGTCVVAGNGTSGDNLSASLSSANSTFSFKESSGAAVTITCTHASFVAQATSNPADGTAEATEQINTLAFSTCTINVAGVTVSSVNLKPTTVGGATVADDSGSPMLNVTQLNEQVTLHTGLGNVICDYGVGGSVTQVQGVITNPDSTGAGGSIAFGTDPVAYLSGPSFCGTAGSTGTFSATFGTVTDTSETGSPALYVL
jgi:hypothetical protein